MKTDDPVFKSILVNRAWPWVASLLSMIAMWFLTAFIIGRYRIEDGRLLWPVLAMCILANLQVSYWVMKKCAALQRRLKSAADGTR